MKLLLIRKRPNLLLMTFNFIAEKSWVTYLHDFLASNNDLGRRP